MGKMFLGGGTYGNVYAEPGGHTVKKVMPLTYVDEEGSEFLVNDIVIETSALVRMSTCGVPYVVRPLGCGLTNGGKDFAIILERLDELHVSYSTAGDTVKRRIAQLFTALACMHEVDIYHGDMKPANLMLDPITGDLRVIDFGMARMDTDRISAHAEDLYTLSYRPPELLLHCNNFDRSRADVWAAGVTACEMMLEDEFIIDGLHDWKSAMFDVIQQFGLPRYASMWPRWSLFNNTMDMERLESAPVDTKVAAMRGPEAADFIRRACDPNPSDRWSAARLLGHPYICGVVPMIHVAQPVSVTLRATPDPFWRWKTASRVKRILIVTELIRILGIPIDNLQCYNGATSVCSAYLFEWPETGVDIGGISAILSRPETFAFLSKRIVTLIDDY